MRLIKPGFIIETPFAQLGIDLIKRIERAGRTCYKSEDKITDDSCTKFVQMIIKNGHHSVLEHESVSVRIICDRGVTHEIVRHRIASYSQESTRYCDYAGGHLTFIIPSWLDIIPGEYVELKELNNPDSYWFNHMLWSEKTYRYQRNSGWKPEQARSILPNSLKTEIVMSANLREWRHFFTLRTSAKAHPQMREIAIPMLNAFKQFIPVIFNDIQAGEN